MKTLLIALSLFISTNAFTNPLLATNHYSLITNVLPSHYVYIDATDPKEPYYHAAGDCMDIKKGHKVEKVSLKDAENKYHLKPCPECYKPKK
jgi:hypothetical protein